MNLIQLENVPESIRRVQSLGKVMKAVRVLVAAVLFLLPVGCATTKDEAPKTLGDWQRDSQPQWH